MAKSRSIGGIYASLSLRDGGFKRGLSSASKSLKGFASGVARHAVGQQLSQFFDKLKGAGSIAALSMVDDLGDVSAQTGIAISDMMRLQRAYADGGREASNVGKDVGKMQKALVEAASGGSDPFSSIGLSAKELLKLDPSQQFQQIGESIMRIQNPAERTAKAMEIFGKGGMGLVTVFGGIDGAVKSLGKMPELAERFGAAMGEANDLIGHLPVKSDQFFVGFTSGLIGTLLPGLQKIDEYDFTELGQGLAEALLGAISIGADALNGWAATFNTIFDGVTSGFGMIEDFDFTKTWEKYADAGQEQFAEWRQMNSKPEDAQKVIEPIITTIMPTMMKQAMVDPQKAAFQVNEYQRRGLSLGANPDGKKIDTQIDLMTQMRDYMKKIAEKNGAQVWV